MDRLLTPTKLAEIIDRPEKTLSQWRYRRIGPPYIKLENGHVRYRESDVAEWLDAGLVAPGRAA